MLIRFPKQLSNETHKSAKEVIPGSWDENSRRLFNDLHKLKKEDEDVVAWLSWEKSRLLK